MVPKKELIRVSKKINIKSESFYKVYAHNDVYIGEFLMKEDGYYDFWPELKGGYWSSYMMRAIADKLDEINLEWDTIIKNDSSINTSVTIRE